MRRLVIVVSVLAALGAAGCSNDYYGPHPTPMQTGSATYNPARDRLVTYLTAAGWDKSEITLGNPVGEFYNASVPVAVGQKTCTIEVTYVPSQPPTYMVIGIAGRGVTAWTRADPAEFNTPGIDRSTLTERLRKALGNGAITC